MCDGINTILEPCVGSEQFPGVALLLLSCGLRRRADRSTIYDNCAYARFIEKVSYRALDQTAAPVLSANTHLDLQWIGWLGEHTQQSPARMFTVLGMNEIKRFSPDDFFGAKSKNGSAGRRGVEYLASGRYKGDHIGVVLDLSRDSSHLAHPSLAFLRRENLVHAETTAVR